MAKKTLEMTFRKSDGNETVISLADPKDDLTLAQVQTVMQDIITKNLFVVKTATLAEIVEAQIRVVDVTELV